MVQTSLPRGLSVEALLFHSPLFLLSLYSQDRSAFTHRLQAGSSPGHRIFLCRHAIHACGTLRRSFPALVLVPLQAGLLSSPVSQEGHDAVVKQGEGNEHSSACVNAMEAGMEEGSCV